MSSEYNESQNYNTSDAHTGLFDSAKRLWRSYKKHWWISVVCSVLLAAISFTYFKLTFVPEYRSEVRFSITPLVESDASNGASVYSFNYNSTLATQMAATFPYVIDSGIMADIIANDIRRPFSARISSEAIAETNIFEISVTSSSPQDAYDVLNSIIKNYPKVAEYVVGDTHMTIIEGSEPAMPTSPSNKYDYMKYVLLLTVLGIAVGVAVAVVDMRAVKTVIGRRDIETYFNGKCMAEIPAAKQKRSGKASAMLKIGPSLSGFSESIRVLKQRVRSALKSNGTKIVGITSSVSGEGKTTISYNLARSLSGSEERVLLIDMDLHNRSIQTSLNRRQEVPNTGVTDVVVGKVELEDVINSMSNTLDVIFAGEENVKFRRMGFAQIFEYAREHYDYIIVDLPTCGLYSETVQMADLCDEVLFVVRSDTVSPEVVYSSLKDIAFSSVSVMGFVINAINQNLSEMGGYKYYSRYGRRRYGYGYGYGHSRSYSSSYGTLDTDSPDNNKS